MKNKKLIKYIVFSFVILGLAIIFIFSFERIKTRILIAVNKTSSMMSLTVKHSKKKGVFLWEYEIPVKEIFYEDSIRKIHFLMERAFAEKEWALNTDSSNYISIHENASYIIIPSKIFNVPKNSQYPDGVWSTWDIAGNGSVNRSTNLFFRYKDILPPDTLTAHIIAINKDEDLKPLSGNGDTLVSFSLYRKFE
ncbi:MAG: hypothetical protein LBQ22_04890 [Bacteroidales bacterium]|jgi:hypothetical protein|nr:hypothetical protein [Bacteroidales bacterium]